MYVIEEFVVSENPVETSNGVPAELRDFPQWVCSDNDKVPINPRNCKFAKTNDPSTWASYGEAVAAKQKYALPGIGFVLTKEDPFLVVDLDGCIDPVTGELARWADEVTNRFSGTYIERSQGDTGLHIVARGRPPIETKRLWRDEPQGIEVYADGQYVALTGKKLSGEAILDRQEALEWLYEECLDAKECEHEENTVAVSSAAPLALSDDELLSKMATAGKSKEFNKLFRAGDTSEYPSHSEADLALCGMLAFWTQRDPERVDRLFRKSGLMRPKWDERHYADGSTYGQNTIKVAVQNCSQVYDPSQGFEASEEVQGLLDLCMEELLLDPWPGRSGATDRNVLKALIQIARKHGKPHQEGVAVARSVRDLALDAGCGSTKTVSKSIKRLEEKRRIRVIQKGTSHVASMYLILVNSNVPHKLHVRGGVNYGVSSSTKVRRPYTPPSEEYSSDGRKLSGGSAITSIGPRKAQILDYVHSEANPVTIEQIATYLGQKKHYVKSQHLKRLLDEGLLVQVPSGAYDTPSDIEDRLRGHLEDSGCVARESKQRKEVEREREVYSQRQHRVSKTEHELCRDRIRA